MKMLLACAVLGGIALSGCTPIEGAYHTKPELKGAATLPYAKGTTTSQIASDLKALEFEILSVTPVSVEATTDQLSFVDCGTIVQYRDGKRTEFSGASPLSVLYLEPGTNNFSSRELAVNTHVRVQLAGNSAILTQRIEVSVKWINYDEFGRPLGSLRQTGTATSGVPINFKDGTTCGVGNSLLEALG